MAKKSDALTPKQRHALELLISGKGMLYKDICAEVGINPSTLYEWRTSHDYPRFQEEYERLKQEQWLATVETARASALKLCANGNQKMVEFILKNDGLNPTQKVEADINTDINIIIEE